jgi:hypothetical protein
LEATDALRETNMAGPILISGAAGRKYTCNVTIAFIFAGGLPTEQQEPFRK